MRTTGFSCFTRGRFGLACVEPVSPARGAAATAGLAGLTDRLLEVLSVSRFVALFLRHEREWLERSWRWQWVRCAVRSVSMLLVGYLAQRST